MRQVSTPKPRLGRNALVKGSLIVVTAATVSVGTPTDLHPTAAPVVQERPRLLVVLVVDQLRHDLLLRYRDLYSGGLRRLLDAGMITAATHDHGVTETSPGHATLATGTHPSRHGVVANQWFGSSEGAWIYAVSDPSTSISGHPLEGSSPHFLRREGIADWLVASDSSSQVVSVSAKDRAAILLRGLGKGPVFWFEPAVGEFVSSTYYMARPPSWLTEFNASRRDSWAADSIWASKVPDAAANRTRPDTAVFEGDQVHTFFPHRYHEEGGPGSLAGEGIGDTGGYFEWFATTPALDRAVLDLAKTSVISQDLGQDDHLDLLAVSLSQTDRVGHAYGPLSREQLDNLLRLDTALGEFLAFLDEQIPGGWLLGMSADHGVRNIPEYDRRPDGSTDPRLTPEDRISMLRSIVRAVEESRGGAVISPAVTAAEAATTSPFVAGAWVLGQPVEPEDSLGLLMNRSFVVGRPPRIEARFGIGVAFHEGVLDSTNPSGTTHGSPYVYDRTVPFLIYRPTNPEGLAFTDATPRAVDFAPTLAALAGIPVPDDLDGQSVVEESVGRINP